MRSNARAKFLLGIRMLKPMTLFNSSVRSYTHTHYTHHTHTRIKRERKRKKTRKRRRRREVREDHKGKEREKA